MSKLILAYKYDSSFFDRRLARDDFGRLSMAVDTDRVSGRGGFWVQWQDVREFGQALYTFPIREDQPVVARWGFDMHDGDDLILSLKVSPADKRGNLIVRFEVSDDTAPQNRVQGEFLTNYPELGAFADQIVGMMDRDLEQAVLNGD